MRTDKNRVLRRNKQKPGLAPGFFCEKSPEFQGFHRFFGLVVDEVLSKVRFMPA
ncbi:hypothetical protein ABUE31_05280 [Mesorhizobium sp. ZMM04-5]|uniref:Uncharacterized protein n=1 Tax=Mesorhizobium marinum TaxID=3228790 RepID=A0ABV3QWE4_9HYPH